MFGYRTREINDRFGNPVADVVLCGCKVIVETYPLPGAPGSKTVETTEHATDEAAAEAYCETCDNLTAK